MSGLNVKDSALLSSLKISKKIRRKTAEKNGKEKWKAIKSRERGRKSVEVLVV